MLARRGVLSGACALALAVALAACSSNSKNTSTSATTSASQSAGASTSAPSTGTPIKATGAPINVGIICACSGVYAGVNQDGEDAYTAFVNTVNASGGINGHPIHLTVENDQGLPGNSLADVQTLISDHVDAIDDITTLDATWEAQVKAANIPVIGLIPAGVPFYTNSDFYNEGGTNDSAVYAVVATAKAAGATNLGVIYCAEAPVCQALVPLVKADGQKLGLPVTYSASIAAASPNYTAQCVAAQEAHVTALAVFDTTAPNVRLATNCTTQGYDPIYVTEGQGFSANQAQAPGFSKSLWSEYPNIPYWDTSSPAVQAMTAAVNKYYPGLQNNPVAWTEGGAEGWPAGLLLEDAVKAGGLTASGTPSAAEIVKGLESLHGDTLDGWAPPLTFPAGQVHPIDCWFIGRVQNGTPSLANNGQPACENGTS
jgi:branched-chain amino acid transport system substrate-binding protein